MRGPLRRRLCRNPHLGVSESPVQRGAHHREDVAGERLIMSARTVLVQLGLSGTGSRNARGLPHPRLSRASTHPQNDFRPYAGVALDPSRQGLYASPRPGAFRMRPAGLRYSSSKLIRWNRQPSRLALKGLVRLFLATCKNVTRTLQLILLLN